MLTSYLMTLSTESVCLGLIVYIVLCIWFRSDEFVNERAWLEVRSCMLSTLAMCPRCLGFWLCVIGSILWLLHDLVRFDYGISANLLTAAIVLISSYGFFNFLDHINDVKR